MSETQCPDCEGAGKIIVGEHLVTREMAHDAGDLRLEGTHAQYEYAECSRCGGGGAVEATMTKKELLKYWGCIQMLYCDQAQDCPMGTGKAVECLEAIDDITALIEALPDTAAESSVPKDGEPEGEKP